MESKKQTTCDNQTCYMLKRETKISREIRILAEVEKIWIQYDIDQNGELDFDEISEYLRNRSCSHCDLTHA